MTPQEMEDYDPPEGARVEVLQVLTSRRPLVGGRAVLYYGSWWEGEVRQKKGGFYSINFPDEPEMVNSQP
jgi:hypothetical protein